MIWFFFNDNLESVFIEIDKCVYGTRIIVVAVLYRAPAGNVEEFLMHMELLLTTLSRENVSIYMMGDYNLNILNADKHRLTAEFIDMMFSYHMMPLINKPTRINLQSSTLIDNIFSNGIVDETFFNGILCTDISDHLPIFTINVSNQIKDKSCSVKRRVYSKSNIDKFQNSLKAKNWDAISGIDNCQAAFTKFHKFYCDSFEMCFPLVEVKPNYHNRKPWLTEALKKSIKVKNRLYVTSLKRPYVNNINKYNNYKRILQRTMRNAEREHYDKLFKENANNLRESWKILNGLINRKKKTFKTSKFKINNSEISDSNIIAECFNDFFVNIGPNLSKEIPSSNRDYRSYMSNNNVNSIFLAPVTINEVVNLIKFFQNKIPVWDTVNARIVKETYPIIINSLLHIINLSLSQGVFPSELKIAKVIPIFKGGDCNSNF